MRKLICFPFAGAGASLFRPWAEALADTLVVTAVQLPGRENRFAEESYTQVEQAIDDLDADLDALLDGATDITLFGHSLGAVLAYELALRIDRAAPDLPCRLVVSGSPSPSRPRVQHASGLSDAQFLAQVREFAGYSHPSLDDPEMRELLLPVLRADVEMHEAYSSHDKAPIGMPVIAVRGRDDELVSAAELAAWQAVTTRPLQTLEVDGGHMYLTDHPQPLFGLLRQTMALA
ncbi:alpha/beta fold hydrolase [Caballeronia sp. dw_276]|uniref:thioesterase II family protein n=1 Tax=Caballeronia sp. dw_276 TaxID=2719795 RepID=UPI001BD3659D|nr:alpha/beta fold hydrolase [Caballeronia sp. dw_276]